ncbi:hypothetical protein ASPSYDRAFT_42095 [Aspergillus sydowii CBS 593.65]|uniref:FAD-binding PCMH-type domain-containing protein n=1 Tax=Aspergillus sydowii CBS 593.65 TaxID=1036612 RepID=A0A1L9TLR2_9EURO|nr:uncharacterized protein ASPSYDRAFT_42095 [Aspergillus sydowii CBS 593.65]OJJ60367.1 hypothetical protein ASPSYDRAFT_42095 [Aspergillus sydowii CBS 593.65]
MRLAPTVAAALLGLLPELTLATGTGSSPEASADQCCAALSKSKVGDKVVRPSSAAYKKSVHSYWSVNVQLEPTCIVQPESADDVSAAVKTLTTAGGDSPCKFAVRSGGHMTWAGSNNIETGVTVDLSNMNSTVYDKEAGIASILPGARWQAVYKTLEKYNVVVPGGRTGPVGVGGFLLGGGNSFHAARVGLACDSVENYEVVLASGRIVNANNATNRDLFKALKGGANNFGIVTKYDLKTIDNAHMWGGLTVSAPNSTEQVIQSAVKFTDNIEKDPYASWIGLWTYNATVDQLTVGSLMQYTKPVPRPAAYNDFYKIPNVSSTNGPQTLLQATTEIQQAGGKRNAFLTGTYLNSDDVLRKALEIQKRKIEDAKTVAKGKDYVLLVIIQPWPKLFWQLNQGNGIGNVLGLERFDENMIQVLYDYTWEEEDDDGVFQRLAEESLNELDDYARDAGKYNEYVYLNYADGSQNPLSGYGDESVEYMREVAQRYDPDGVFQTQVPGGFKVSEA